MTSRAPRPVSRLAEPGPGPAIGRMMLAGLFVVVWTTPVVIVVSPSADPVGLAAGLACILLAATLFSLTARARESLRRSELRRGLITLLAVRVGLAIMLPLALLLDGLPVLAGLLIARAIGVAETLADPRPWPTFVATLASASCALPIAAWLLRLCVDAAGPGRAALGCPRCGYAVRTIPDVVRCPECGEPVGPFRPSLPDVLARGGPKRTDEASHPAEPASPDAADDQLGPNGGSPPT